MKSYRIAPQDDMIFAVLKLLEHEGPDYTRNMVVFQGKRPAHVLRKRIAEREATSYLPPCIHSADGFIEYLYTEKLGKKKNDVGELDAANILLELQHVLSSYLANDRNRKLESFLPFGMKLFQELEEVKIGNVPATQLHVQIDAFLDQYEMNELVYLRDFYRAFYEKLEAEGQSTRASRYAAVANAAKDIDLDEWTRIIVAGYASPNPSERALFKRLAERENVVFLFQDAEGHAFVEEQFGPLHPGGAAAPAALAPEYHLYESSDAHGQLFALSALLRELQEAGNEPGPETVIVVSKPESLFPLLAYGVGHIPEEKRNVSLGYPFNRTPVYEFIMALMRTVASREGERYFAPTYLDFMLHPYTKNILYGNRADVTRIVLHTIQEEFFTGSTVSLFALDDILGKEKVFTRAAERLAHLDAEVTADDLRAHVQQIHAATITPLERAASIGGLVDALATVLRFIFERSTAKSHPFVLPFFQTAVTELERIGASDIARHAFDDAAAYERLLKRTLGGVRQPFPGTPLRGLQILGLLETRSLKFERVIVLDANEDALPGGRSADMLLPQRIRQDFGLMTYGLQDRLSEHYFHLLCQGAKEVHIMYRSGNGMERSRFVEQIVWQEQQQRGGISEGGLTRTIQYCVDLKNPLPQPIEKTPAMMQALRGRPLSATGIDRYLHCGLKFYYNYVLSLRKQEEVSGAIESMEIGSAVHEILEEYFTPCIGRPLTPDDINADRIADRTRGWFAERYGVPATGETLLVRTQVERRLRDFMTLYQTPLVTKHAVTILGLEEAIGIEASGVRMRGVLDRVESRDGTVYILDYKTGGALPSIRLNQLDPDARETWNRAIGSVQLPMYIKLYAAEHRVEPGAIVPLYVHLGRSHIDGKTERGVGKDASTSAEWFPMLDAVIDGLVKEIHDPGLPFYPPEDPARACAWCEFKTVCGTRWV